MYRYLIIAAVSMAASQGVFAEDKHHQPNHPYAGEQQRVIKALSAQDIGDLEAGRGMGLSKVAELNHYPGPKHALELAEPLQLSALQMQHVQQLQNTMQQEAQHLGRQIFVKEAALDAIFAARRADDGTVRALLADIGQLQGDLRFIHINAHLATARLLSPAQIAAYDRLRGYDGGSAAIHAHH